jgi:hypothetical protein
MSLTPLDHKADSPLLYVLVLLHKVDSASRPLLGAAKLSGFWIAALVANFVIVGDGKIFCPERFGRHLACTIGPISSS